jgi:hypothetical protein
MMRPVSLLFFLVLLALPGFAQTAAKRNPGFTVRVPFEFTLGDRTLPAGTYTVRRVLNSAPDASEIEIVTLQTPWTTYQSTVAKIEKSARLETLPKVAFHKRGAQVELSAITVGRTRLLFSKNREEMARTQDADEQIELLADLTPAADIVFFAQQQ